MNAINRVRSARGLPQLQVGPRLQAAARAHSRAMARSGSFTHGNWYYRLRRFGVRGRVLGENIAWGVGHLGSPRQIMRAWMNSPGHRANILNRRFREVGIGIVFHAPRGSAAAVAATYTTTFGYRR